MMRRVRRGLSALVAVFLLAGPAVAAEDGIVMGAVLEPPHLDPTAGAAAAIDEVVYANVFEGLTRVDRNGAVLPALAESWEVSEDGKRYGFKLREGVTFHDGSSFEAADVVFSLERARAEDSVNAQKGLFEPIDSIEAEGNDRVVITLKRPSGNFLFNLGWGDAVIVAPETAEANKSNPVGTGPFRLRRWVQGDRVELERYDDYWGVPVKLSEATFKFIPDPAAAAAAMLAGDIDAFANFPAPETMAQFEADPRFEVVIGTTEGETILSTNNARPPFDDVRVRQAMAHALERGAVIDGAMFGYGTPIGSHFAPHHPAYIDLTGQRPHDLEKARALMAEAGHAEGFDATLKLPPPSYARRGGEIVAAQLAKIGIRLELIPVEWAQSGWSRSFVQHRLSPDHRLPHRAHADMGIYARDKYYFNYANPGLQGGHGQACRRGGRGPRNATSIDG